MQIHFPGVNQKTIFEDIQRKLAHRKLSSMVNLELSGNILTILISKMGTSKIRFQISEQCQDSSEERSTHMVLIDKKIAMAHRLLEAEIMKKLEQVITRSGGKIT